jgi:hypothetical protein
VVVSVEPLTEQFPEATAKLIAPPPEPPVVVRLRSVPYLALVDVTTTFEGCSDLVTTSLNDAVEVLVTLVALIVYGVADVATVGVPVIAPVAVFKVNPAGSVGVTAKLAIAPPVEAMA